MTSVLIIEDDVTFSQLLESFLKRNGYSVTISHDIRTGKKNLEQNRYGLLLLDYRLPDGSGIDILRWMRDAQLQTPAIVMTSFHDIRTAVTTIRLGAYDYITKPVNPDELLLVIREATTVKNGKQQHSTEATDYIKGTSIAAEKLEQHIKLVAPTDFSVIITGDSGTGKEIAARNIHALSKRNKAPFIALDCGALSAEIAGSTLFGHVKGAFTGAIQNKRGHFEEANGGTLFLDEVGNLSYEIQVKLLRALQEREIQPIGSNEKISVDVRILCATNENLFNAVRNGKFREDLYHRLNEFTLHIPSLQERSEDIPVFTDHFIRQTNEELGKHVTAISKEALSLFLEYDWPGNLRELKNIVKRAVLLADTNTIGISALPQEMIFSVQQTPSPETGLRTSQEANEKEIILKTLQEVRYNKSKAAKKLNIDRSTLYYKLSKYGIR